MQHLRFPKSSHVVACLLAAIGISLTACSSAGGSGHTASATPTTSAPARSSAPTSGAEPTSGPSAIAAIKKNWATFFNAKTKLARRLALLQNGQAFKAVIKAQSHLQLATAATAKVSHVTLTGTNQAPVTYSILINGQPALSNQRGVAVYQNGVWKVGLVSFCALLQIENAGKSSGLPAACKK
jgi:hypothetical protein